MNHTPGACAVAVLGHSIDNISIDKNCLQVSIDVNMIQKCGPDQQRSGYVVYSSCWLPRN